MPEHIIILLTGIVIDCRISESLFPIKGYRPGTNISGADILVKVVVEKGRDKGAVFRLHDGVNMLGRDIGSRIALVDPRISRQHCTIRKVGQTLYLADLSTRNGTIVNGESVSECEVGIGDSIVIGNTVLRIVDEEYEPDREPAEPGPFSFFQSISMAIFGKRREVPTGAHGKDHDGLRPRRLRALWRPPARSNPPERRSKTVSSTDPD